MKNTPSAKGWSNLRPNMRSTSKRDLEKKRHALHEKLEKLEIKHEEHEQMERYRQREISSTINDRTNPQVISYPRRITGS